jgi:mevalonate kinase
VKEFYSNGKLLISGEYVVLDGAISLALPTKYGQSLNITSLNEPKIVWKSLDESGKVWFQGEFKQKKGKFFALNSDELSSRLIQILEVAKSLNADFLEEEFGYSVITKLDFPSNWGLGTSSTLINNIANWAQVDAYILLQKTFGGSGYDIACAQNNLPISYQLKKSDKKISLLDFNPSFRENLFFVHLNKKQNSRDGIKHYREHKGNLESSIDLINEITIGMINCNNLSSFQGLIEKHENIIAEITKQITVKERLFKDFIGAIKSLGAWGGDFVLVASKTNPTSYFKTKGYQTVITYDDMIL